jgi:hypothetical protein
MRKSRGIGLLFRGVVAAAFTSERRPAPKRVRAFVPLKPAFMGSGQWAGKVGS